MVQNEKGIHWHRVEILSHTAGSRTLKQITSLCFSLSAVSSAQGRSKAASPSRPSDGPKAPPEVPPLHMVLGKAQDWFWLAGLDHVPILKSLGDAVLLLARPESHVHRSSGRDMELTPCNSHRVKEEGKLGIPGQDQWVLFTHYPEAVTSVNLGLHFGLHTSRLLLLCVFIFLFYCLLCVYINML